MPEPEQYSEAWDRESILPPLRPQAYSPADPVDGEGRGQYVNLRVWVSTRVEDPVARVRGMVVEDDDVSLMESWLEDPE